MPDFARLTDGKFNIWNRNCISDNYDTSLNGRPSPWVGKGEGIYDALETLSVFIPIEKEVFGIAPNASGCCGVILFYSH